KPCILARSSISSRRFGEKPCGTNNPVERICHEKMHFPSGRDFGAYGFGFSASFNQKSLVEFGTACQSILSCNSRNTQSARPSATCSGSARPLGSSPHLRAERTRPLLRARLCRCARPPLPDGALEALRRGPPCGNPRAERRPARRQCP